MQVSYEDIKGYAQARRALEPSLRKMEASVDEDISRQNELIRQLEEAPRSEAMTDLLEELAQVGESRIYNVEKFQEAVDESLEELSQEISQHEQAIVDLQEIWKKIQGHFGQKSSRYEDWREQLATIDDLAVIGSNEVEKDLQVLYQLQREAYTQEFERLQQRLQQIEAELVETEAGLERVSEEEEEAKANQEAAMEKYTQYNEQWQAERAIYEKEQQPLLEVVSDHPNQEKIDQDLSILVQHVRKDEIDEELKRAIQSSTGEDIPKEPEQWLTDALPSQGLRKKVEVARDFNSEAGESIKKGSSHLFHLLMLVLGGLGKIVLWFAKPLKAGKGVAISYALGMTILLFYIGGFVKNLLFTVGSTVGYMSLVVLITFGVILITSLIVVFVYNMYEDFQVPRHMKELLKKNAPYYVHYGESSILDSFREKENNERSKKNAAIESVAKRSFEQNVISFERLEQLYELATHGPLYPHLLEKHNHLVKEQTSLRKAEQVLHVHYESFLGHPLKEHDLLHLPISFSPLPSFQRIHADVQHEITDERHTVEQLKVILEKHQNWKTETSSKKRPFFKDVLVDRALIADSISEHMWMEVTREEGDLLEAYDDLNERKEQLAEREKQRLDENVQQCRWEIETLNREFAQEKQDLLVGLKKEWDTIHEALQRIVSRREQELYHELGYGLEPYLVFPLHDRQATFEVLSHQYEPLVITYKSVDLQEEAVDTLVQLIVEALYRQTARHFSKQWIYAGNKKNILDRISSAIPFEELDDRKILEFIENDAYLIKKGQSYFEEDETPNIESYFERYRASNGEDEYFYQRIPKKYHFLHMIWPSNRLVGMAQDRIKLESAWFQNLDQFTQSGIIPIVYIEENEFYDVEDETIQAIRKHHRRLTYDLDRQQFEGGESIVLQS